MKYLLIQIIKIYQQTLSYDHGYIGKLFPNLRFCRHSPTCSEYTVEALDRYGVFKGLWLGSKRVLSCHPWGRRPFFDPVPEKSKK